MAGTRGVARKKPGKETRGKPVTTVVVMRLYIAGSAPNSVKAIANLQSICEKHLKDAYRLEVIDVCEYPQRALADGVLVTPSLTKVAPGQVTNVIGNLGDTGSVLAALGVRAGAEG